jgi:hypothetical protein
MFKRLEGHFIEARFIDLTALLKPLLRGRTEGLALLRDAQ